MDREQRVRENLGLARACAARFLGRGVEYDDLYQAACLGLLEATDRFEESRGLRFSTYAVPVILGEVRRLFREGGAVKVSRSLQSLSRRAAQVSAAWTQRTGKSPTLHELAGQLGVSPEEAAQAIGASQAPLSLTSPEDGALLDVPEKPAGPSLTDRIGLQQAIAQLPKEDQALLYLRYVRRKTQAETGSVLGLSQVQVSRREKKLLYALRQALG